MNIFAKIVEKFGRGRRALSLMGDPGVVLPDRPLPGTPSLSKAKAKKARKAAKAARRKNRSR